MDIQKQIAKELKRNIRKYKKALEAAKKLDTKILQLKKKRSVI
jgi:tRNA G10  N-methylase Trm11